MTSGHLPLPPTDSATRVYDAVYTPAENDVWLDNPLIEALPLVLGDEDFGRATHFFPPHRAELRDHAKHARLMYVRRVLQFFAPMEKHVLLYQRFASIIRDGYVARNPIHDLGWSRLHEQLDDLAAKLKYGVAPHEPPSALGFAIVGIGGIGKTLGVNAILRTYPKGLVHRTYTDSFGRVHVLMRTQIVFLKLDCPSCPSDGTLKSLCLNFFQAVDRLTGSTRYYYDYGFKGSKQRTATEMLPDMARVAALHSIGLLIIDEIQFLSKQKSGGRELMLHWFTELVNTIKLPVVLIGTPRAEEILNSAFWQMRRNAGQGEGAWERMTQGEEWDRFLRSLWRYQYVRSPAELVEVPGQAGKQVPRDLSEMLYRESQGIADFAVKMFMIAQERAINSGFERLTPELIEVVAKDAFGKAREIIQAIKDNDKTILAKVDDVKFNVKRARQEAEARGGRRGPTPAVNIESSSPTAPEGNAGSTPATPPEPARPEGTLLMPVLPALVAEALSHGESGAAALRAAEYVRPPAEFGI